MLVINSIALYKAEEWKNEERNWQANLLSHFREAEQNQHLRMLYSRYEAGKNVNPERIPGTCEWFLRHDSFVTWRESQCSNLLWISADPGCGKSVLAKHLVDRKSEALTVRQESPILCYFFFKDGDKDRMDATKAICAFLHPLILQDPHLYCHAEPDFQTKGDQFLDDLDALWNIFLKATEDPSCREIICVLDALDECRDASREALIAKLVQLYHSRDSSNLGKPILKFLVTSRPEYHIKRDLESLKGIFPGVRLRGEDESEQISCEINLVIGRRVKELGRQMELSETDQAFLQENLSKVPHRTYLWLHLTLDSIRKKLEFSKDEIAVIANSIPSTVGEAYKNILNKSPNPERARKLLHIVLAANRPLTLQETNIAMVINESHQSHKDLDLWNPTGLVDKIKNICGLFLSVVDSRVYLIHQTAREFLVHKGPMESFPGLRASSPP